MKNQVTTIYKQAERFADLTKVAIINGNINRAKRFLTFAEQLLSTGSNETKSVICGIYLHSVTTFMEARHCAITNLFPQSLKAEYLKQINTSGI